ncbi:hypothetical protein LN042_33260 [Kitasatospora sp. RB6PN24]|uniref:RHS repeat-associated core domain-containing protein n=1 Tax=Kitasatospora humi TaxID=2893891 RepID=UPI001E443EF9|nr:RHS repeat-associated core domain-containing protein [Kitasatospora humi]MCC9311876.1 hypothetical protein [Kitasatospora humi]
MAAHRPHGKVWTPNTPLGAQKPVKGKNLVPAKPKAPEFPVPPNWNPAGSAPAAAAPGTSTVTLGNTPSQAGQLPVKVAAGKNDSGRAVKVQVTSANQGRAAGATGPVVALTDSGSSAGSADQSVNVALDLKTLQGSASAMTADRTRLVALPACALNTPQLAECQKQTPVASSVDPKTGVLTAEVALPAVPGIVKSSLPGSADNAGRAEQAGLVRSTAVQASTGTAAPLVLAATTSSSGTTGTYTASPLSPSAAWGAGSNIGSFTYSYPIQTPSSLGGAVPQVTLSYNSSSIDGKTSATNAQTSWVGEGWDYQPGFIERSYQGCGNDGITNSGDECWGGKNATLNLAGHSGTLVRDDTTGVWHLQGDDGSKVEQLTGAANEAHNGEYWRVTTTDGVQYYFGQNHLPGGNHSDAATNSVDYVPVYSPKSGDDCYNASTGSNSWCQEGWRWNLDYVVDPNQNLTTYNYQQDINYYTQGGGQNNGSGTLAKYVRATEVTQISYGQRLPDQIAANGTAKPAAQVLFSTTERCVASGSVTCTSAQRTKANQTNWPDSPLDQACPSSGTCTNYSPTFWSPLMLSTISTQVLVGSAYTTVDSWALSHTFPDPGDGTKPALWLSSIQRTGTDGQPAVKLPAVSFTPRELPNRVDGLVPAEPAFNRPRLQQITTETGGQIFMNYSTPECSRVNNHMPSSEDSNTMACMPVHWYLPGSSSPDPVNDWFNKYLVTSVNEQDAVTGSSMVKSTTYSYGGGAAWHRNDNDLTDPKTRTWDDFRGYQTVTTTLGSGNTGEAPKTQQVSTYLRGMNGDYLANGTTRSVTASFTPYPGATAVTMTDDDWLSDQVLGSQTYDQAGGSVVSASASVSSGPVVTATHKQQNSMPNLVARYDETSSTDSAWAKLANGSWRNTNKVTTRDPNNGDRPTMVDDKGDGTAGAPEICTTTSYATGSNPAMLELVSQSRAVTGPCGTAPNAANTVSDNRTLYDGLPLGQAGGTGAATTTQGIDSYDGSGQPQYVTLTTSSYDVYGRVTSAAGPDGAATKTAYTPATGALPTALSVTGPMGASWANTKTMDPGRGLPLTATDANGRVTTEQYDGLGRLTAVWQPDRATNLSPNDKFSYSVNGVTGPSVVTSQTINEDSSYQTKNELYDGLGRLQQTQTTPAVGGAGRLITDTVYDSHGWAIKTSSPYFDNTTSPNGTIFAPQDAQVPAQNWVTFDGQGRPVTSAFVSYGQQQWVTSTAYPGADRTDVTPPQGTTPTSTVTDARGRTVQQWQYHGSTPTGSPTDADITTTTYTASGQPATRTDSSGNTWSYTYDLRGRQTSQKDPDTGTSSTAYDADSQVTSTTDAKGNTLAYTYDILGRKTGMYQGNVTPANQLAGWTYDTLAKGQLTSSTRYVGGASGTAYTQAVTGYDTMYRPTGNSVTLPSTEGALAGTYSTSNYYTPVLGSLDHTDLPAVGGLPAEEVDYLYIVTGLMIGSAGNNSLVTDVQYDALGRATRTTVGDYGTQVVSTQQYDWATGRVVKSFLDRQTGTTSLDQTSYTFNPAGQMTSATDLQNASATDTQCFTYDYLGRLTNAWTDTAGTTTKAAPSVPGIGACNNAGGPAMTGTPAKPSVGGPSPYWQTYTYDSTGNRTSLVQHDVSGNTANDITTTQTFGAAQTPNTPTSAPNTGGGTGGPHGLLTASTKSASGTATASYQYDATGNTTSITDTSGTTTLTWNGEDKLNSVTKSGQSSGTSYLYDADGNQLIRRDPGKTTLNLGADELTLDTASNSMSDVRYYSSPGGITITRVTAATGGGTLVYQASDPHGTNGVQIGIDAAQTVTRRPTDPFGNPRGTQPALGTWSGDKGFVGGTLDPTTGLTNLGAREYDPSHGRFLNPDPLMAAADPQQWNGYAYSNDNPVNSSDPSGAMHGPDYYGADPTEGSACDAQCYADMPMNTRTALPDGSYTDDPKYQPTTSSNGAGSGGNGDGTGGSHKGGGKAATGNARGTKKCSGLLDLGCHLNNAAKRVENYTTDHPVVRALTVAVVTTVAGGLCYGGGAVGALETAGASAVAAAATCGAAVAALGAGLNNMLDGNADHSAGALATDEAFAAVQGAAWGGAFAAIGGAGAGGCNSFLPGTKVLMADGTGKPIEQITTNDSVTATDPQTGSTKAEQVTDAITTPDDKEFTDLSLTSGTITLSITSTQHHPYWDLTTNRWTDAADLGTGDQLRQPDGSTVTVTAIRSYETPQQVTHNLTIDQLHTYYVLAGNTPVLVHNSDLPCPETYWPKGKASNVCTISGSNGCEDVARSVQQSIGGTRMRITDRYGAPTLGKYRGQDSLWGHHDVVVKDDRVYDAWTGPGGEPMDVYRSQFEYGDDLVFTPLH